MAYQINKTDGTIVATVADGQIDDISTDLTLIGKNYSGYGEAFNENFVKVLENFANVSQPENPIRGQIWFDSSESKLKVYNGTTFVPVSSATISGTQPSTLAIGDLWFNDLDKQLYFFDGTDAILLGPDYSQSQLLSGIQVDSILDTLNQTRVITKFFTNGILLGIFSKDTFTPKNPIVGFSGSIQPGFNAGSLPGIKFNVTAADADSLGGTPATSYVRSDSSGNINGQLALRNDLGLVVGSSGTTSLSVENQDLVLRNSANNKNIIFDVRRDTSQENALVVDSLARKIGLYDDFSNSEVSIGGDLTIKGDVTIRGNFTINDGDIAQIKTSELVVEDKVIVLAQTGDSASNTNETADGGGIILKGADDHIILWSNEGQAAVGSYPALLSNAWTFSDHVNLATNKYYAIDGIPVLEQTNSTPGSQTFKLTAAVTAIEGVSSFGKQNVITVGPGSVSADPYLRITNATISTEQNQDLTISPESGQNIILGNSPRIQGLADPRSGTGGEQDAATREYVDSTIESRPIVLSIDLSDGKPNSYIISNILDNVAPVSEFRSGTVARILCNIINNSTTSVDLDPLILAGTSLATFNTPTGTAPAVTSITPGIANISASSISTTRIIKEFQIVGPESSKSWDFVNDLILPP